MSGKNGAYALSLLLSVLVLFILRCPIFSLVRMAKRNEQMFYFEKNVDTSKHSYTLRLAPLGRCNLWALAGLLLIRMNKQSDGRARDGKVRAGPRLCESN